MRVRNCVARLPISSTNCSRQTISGVAHTAVPFVVARKTQSCEGSRRPFRVTKDQFVACSDRNWDFVPTASVFMRIFPYAWISLSQSRFVRERLRRQDTRLQLPYRVTRIAWQVTLRSRRASFSSIHEILTSNFSSVIIIG